MNEAKVVRTMAALSNGTRFEIFRLLSAQGAAGLSPSIVAERLEIGQSVTSYHLFKLMRAGLVSRRRDGSRVVYTADPAAARECLSLAGTMGWPG